MLLTRPESNTWRIDDVLRQNNPCARAVTIIDQRSLDLVFESFKPDVMVHTACSYGRKSEGVVDMVRLNVLYGLELMSRMELACDSGSMTFLNFDSALNPNVNNYALSKSHFAIWGKEFVGNSEKPMQFINLRLQQMYGPGDDDSKFVAKVIKACVSCEPFLKVTGGEQQRDFIYIEDVVRACDTVLMSRGSLPKVHDIDVGTGKTVSIRDYVNLVHRMAQSSTQIEFGAVPYRKNEPMVCIADTKEILRLGWAPQFSLHDGLSNVINGLKNRTNI